MQKTGVDYYTLNLMNSISVNKNNQLVLKEPPKRKLRVLKGNFKISKDNNLIYIVNESSNWRRIHNIPGRIEFEGNWRLNSNYDLVLNVKEEKRYFRRSLVLRGEILDLDENSLIFKIKSKVSASVTRISSLKLKGKWRADKFNRIVFEVSKKVDSDLLVFKGAWSVNKNQQIIYKYRKLKTKKDYTLVFKGFWEITSKNRLSYILEDSPHRCFNFRVQLETPNVYPAEGKIKYRIGIGVRRVRKERVIVLYGVWKFSRKFGLVFEMNYGEHKIRRLQFSVRISLSKKDKVIFMLRDSKNKSLGLSLTYKRRFLPEKDFEYFLRLKKEGEVIHPELGGRLRF